MSQQDVGAKAQIDHVLLLVRLPIFLALCGNSIVIPDSYDLAMRLGGGPVFSGSIAGTTSTGFFVGTAILWLVGRKWPYFWRDGPRMVQCIGVLLGFLSAFLYLTVCFAAGVAMPTSELVIDALGHKHEQDSVYAPSPPEMFGWQSGAFRKVVLAGQLIQGMSGSCFIAISAQVIANIAEAEDRPRYSGLMTEFAMLGIGLGPIAAAGAHALYRVVFNVGVRRFLSVGIAKLLLCLIIGILLMTKRLPPLASYASDGGFPKTIKVTNNDGEEEPLKIASSPEVAGLGGSYQAAPPKSNFRMPHRSVQRRICGVLLVACLLHFMVSGLEVASVMVLEVEFGWNAARAGLVVGITFLCGLPLRRILLMAKESSESETKTITLIRLLLLILAGSCVLLFRQVCILLDQMSISRVVCVMFLLIADLLFYSSVMFTQSLLRGMAMQCTQAPGDGPFDFTNFFMAWAVFVDLIARTVGAPLARALLSSTAGRDGYALQQLIVLGLAWVIAEAMVLRRVIGDIDDRSEQHVDAPVDRIVDDMADGFKDVPETLRKSCEESCNDICMNFAPANAPDHGPQPVSHVLGKSVVDDPS